MQAKRHYVALASERSRQDTIVFSVYAANPRAVRRLVEEYYLALDWHPLPTHIEVKLERSTEERPVVFLGHALQEYQAFEEQVRALCEKLLNQADDPLDEEYRFVAQFPVGKQVILLRYPDHPYLKEPS